MRTVLDIATELTAVYLHTYRETREYSSGEVWHQSASSSYAVPNDTQEWSTSKSSENQQTATTIIGPGKKVIYVGERAASYTSQYNSWTYVSPVFDTDGNLIGHTTNYGGGNTVVDGYDVHKAMTSYDYELPYATAVISRYGYSDYFKATDSEEEDTPTEYVSPAYTIEGGTFEYYGTKVSNANDTYRYSVETQSNTTTGILKYTTGVTTAPNPNGWEEITWVPTTVISQVYTTINTTIITYVTRQGTFDYTTTQPDLANIKTGTNLLPGFDVYTKVSATVRKLKPPASPDYSLTLGPKMGVFGVVPSTVDFSNVYSYDSMPDEFSFSYGTNLYATVTETVKIATVTHSTDSDGNHYTNGHTHLSNARVTRTLSEYTLPNKASATAVAIQYEEVNDGIANRTGYYQTLSDYFVSIVDGSSAFVTHTTRRVACGARRTQIYYTFDETTTDTFTMLVAAFSITYPTIVPIYTSRATTNEDREPTTYIYLLGQSTASVASYVSYTATGQSTKLQNSGEVTQQVWQSELTDTETYDVNFTDWYKSVVHHVENVTASSSSIYYKSGLAGSCGDALRMTVVEKDTPVGLIGFGMPNIHALNTDEVYIGFTTELVDGSWFSSEGNEEPEPINEEWFSSLRVVALGNLEFIRTEEPDAIASSQFVPHPLLFTDSTSSPTFANSTYVAVTWSATTSVKATIDDRETTISVPTQTVAVYKVILSNKVSTKCHRFADTVAFSIPFVDCSYNNTHYVSSIGRHISDKVNSYIFDPTVYLVGEVDVLVGALSDGSVTGTIHLYDSVCLSSELTTQSLLGISPKFTVNTTSLTHPYPAAGNYFTHQSSFVSV